MMIISRILIQNKYFYRLAAILHKPLSKIFHFESESSSVIFLISFICGNPSTAFNIKSLITQGKMSNIEGRRLAKLLCFPSPLYLYKASSIFPFQIQISILIPLYLVPLFILISSKKGTTFTPTKPHLDQQPPFKLIEEAFLILLKAFSIILFFTMLLCISLKAYPIDKNVSYLIANSLELTAASSFKFIGPIYIEGALFTFFNSLLGLSILIQINMSEVISLKELLKWRLIVASAAFLLYFIIYYGIYMLI